MTAEPFARVTIHREDVGRIESAADALRRLGDTERSIELWALALRFRAESGLWADALPGWEDEPTNVRRIRP